MSLSLLAGNDLDSIRYAEYLHEDIHIGFSLRLLARLYFVYTALYPVNFRVDGYFVDGFRLPVIKSNRSFDNQYLAVFVNELH